MDRRGDAERVVARQKAEHGGVHLVHVDRDTVNSAVVPLRHRTGSIGGIKRRMGLSRDSNHSYIGIIPCRDDPKCPNGYFDWTFARASSMSG